MWPFSSRVKKSVPLGAWGEQVAARHYEKLGYSIVSRNEFNSKGLRLGEVDFIAKTKRDLAFVEVKTRTSQEGKFGSGAEAVSYVKQQKLLRAVYSFLSRRPELADLRPHIDVCVVTASVDRATHSVTIMENSVEDWH